MGETWCHGLPFTGIRSRLMTFGLWKREWTCLVRCTTAHRSITTHSNLRTWILYQVWFRCSWRSWKTAQHVPRLFSSCLVPLPLWAYMLPKFRHTGKWCATELACHTWPRIVSFRLQAFNHVLHKARVVGFMDCFDVGVLRGWYVVIVWFNNLSRGVSVLGNL